MLLHEPPLHLALVNNIMINKKLLNDIINKTPHNHVIVFDLDSTLFDVSYRSQAILNHFIENQEYKKKYSEIDVLKQVQIQSQDWGLKSAVQRCGLRLSAALINDLKSYWQKHFFSNEFLEFDVAYPDAHRFLNHLEKNGHEIFYLTGRDRKNMETGTIKSLLKNNFPLTNENRLIMKAEKGSIEDEDFKVIELRNLYSRFTKNKMNNAEIVMTNNTTILKNKIIFFENEPVIIHKVLAALPQVEIIWLDTTHSGKAPPPTHLATMIGHYEF